MMIFCRETVSLQNMNIEDKNGHDDRDSSSQVDNIVKEVDIQIEKDSQDIMRMLTLSENIVSNVRPMPTKPI